MQKMIFSFALLLMVTVFSGHHASASSTSDDTTDLVTELKIALSYEDTFVVLNENGDNVNESFYSLAAEFIEEEDYHSIIEILLQNNWHFAYEIVVLEDMDIQKGKHTILSETRLRTSYATVHYPFSLQHDYDNDGKDDSASIKLSHTGRFNYNPANNTYVNMPSNYADTSVACVGIPYASVIQCKQLGASAAYSSYTNYVRFHGNVNGIVEEFKVLWQGPKPYSYLSYADGRNIIIE
ncbi:hypothetical protein [Bacillus sp. FJAT-29937]|uniref:hypothetical protein n=1 Tax=Bacillus sp. FJAT-29937 TaxID=1720553 RepID=UPI00082FAC68|nr:hypothetical protein [Bacillus sp. FJAT-29937]